LKEQIQIGNPVAWEREQAEHASVEIAHKESERETDLARIKALRGKAAQGSFEDFEDKKQEIIKLEQSLPVVPQPLRLWAQDITPERLGPLMAENGERLAILSDEGGIFDLIGGRYSNGIPNLDLFLQSYSGSSVRVDRQGRSSVYMEHPALTIGLSPQPEILRGLKGKSGFRGRGLLARFLYAVPQSRLGYRTFDTHPIPHSVQAAYMQNIQMLLSIKPETGSDGGTRPFVLKLCDQAYDEWKDFSRTVERDMREGGRFEHITDWAGKLPGNVIRVAGLLHCAEHCSNQTWSKDIQLETMQQALLLAAVLAGHALVAFDVMGSDPELDTARRIWRWIERAKYKTFSARDCFQALKGTYGHMVELNPGFTVLIERCYLTEKPTENKIGRHGRKFDVNPLLTEEWT